MDKPSNLLDVYYLYEQDIQTANDSEKAKNIISETRTAIVRPFLLGLGYQEVIGSGKLSLSELQAAFAFMKSQKINTLFDARLTQKQGLKLLKNKSHKTQKIYINRLNQFLMWCEQQSWWTAKKVSSINNQDECCPSFITNNVSRRDKKLIQRRGKKFKYKLKTEYISINLQAELQQFSQFLTSPEWPSRVTEPITISGAENYLESILLMLGWFHKYQDIPPEKLSLNLLILKVTNQELNNLNNKEKQKLWKQYQQEFETWFCKYLKFLRETVGSESPRTKISRLTSLSALGKFLYHTEVEDINDYADIPILKIITKYSRLVQEEVSEWKRQKRYVSNQNEKWPEAIGSKTILSTVREQLLSPLRQESRLRDKNGKPRTGSTIALSLQRYLTWSFLADMPARRQEESRNLRISLCCPIKRPKEVPPDGVYHPLPDDLRREKHYDGSIADNYLYKTYSYNREFYKNGIWVLDIQDYKTVKIYCPQSIIIPNRKFEDGSCLYDYIESYLYGSWLPLGHKNRQIYDWWQIELKGCRGRWVTAGRAEFEPQDFCCIANTNADFHTWGYLFVTPNSGRKFKTGEYTQFIQIPAVRLIDKCISPHTMRHIWATWAFQVGLTDQQRESLAYAMGHNVETLKKMYERCTPQEKRRPIEEAIDKLLFDSFELKQSETYLTPEANELALKLQNLNSNERQRLLKMLLR